MRVAIDAHADTVQRIVDLGERFDDEQSTAEVSLAKARRGGLGAQIFSIWIDPTAFTGAAAWPRAKRLVGALREAAGNGGPLRLARRGQEVRAAVAEGRFAVLMGVEGAHALGGDGEPVPERLARLRELAASGVCYLSPTWSNSNDFAGSSGDAGRTRGLSEAGWQLLEACAEVHVLVDVSHVSDPSFDDVLAWARSIGRPIVASHSSARALAEHPRNLTDAQLQTLGDAGGVASVNFCPAFLDEGFRARVTAATSTAAAKAAQEEARRGHDDPGVASLRAWQARSSFARALPAPRLERVVDHLVHMIDKAGEDHVGLGSDFDGISAVPAGLEDVSRLPALADALAARGVGARVVDKIFAENWLRVLDQV